MQSGRQAAEALAAQGRIGEAVALLEAAVARGDAESAFTLGAWRLGHPRCPPNFAAARRLFTLAADAGRRGAPQILAALLAAGIGGARDWPGALALVARLADGGDPLAAMERDLLAAAAIDAGGGPLALPPAEPLRHDPAVSRLPGLLSPGECRFLIAAGGPRLKPAVVVDPVSGRQTRHPVRTSDMATFPVALETPLVHAINRRIAAASGTDVEQGEPLQLLAYCAGEEYRPHLDAIAGAANQRVATLLVYLNAGYEGGATRFLDLGLEVRGGPGDALLFCNVRADGSPDPRTRHAGLPVTSGIKYLASRWIRAKPFRSDPDEAAQPLARSDVPSA